MAEDPANRRINGGNPSSFFIQLIPLFRPEITIVSGSPAISHADDFSPVNAFGESFPANPVVEVISPVGLLVNGKEDRLARNHGSVPHRFPRQ